jgi:hypothetical protein
VRIEAARLQTDLGRADEADRLLHFAYGAPANVRSLHAIMMSRSIALFERARAAERAGRAADAIRDYRSFLRQYDRPPPEHLSSVRAAEQALGRLTGIGDRPKGAGR